MTTYCEDCCKPSRYNIGDDWYVNNCKYCENGKCDIVFILRCCDKKYKYCNKCKMLNKDDNDEDENRFLRDTKFANASQIDELKDDLKKLKNEICDIKTMIKEVVNINKDLIDMIKYAPNIGPGYFEAEKSYTELSQQNNNEL